MKPLFLFLVYFIPLVFIIPFIQRGYIENIYTQYGYGRGINNDDFMKYELIPNKDIPIDSFPFKKVVIDLTQGKNSLSVLPKEGSEKESSALLTHIGSHLNATYTRRSLGMSDFGALYEEILVLDTQYTPFIHPSGWMSTGVKSLSDDFFKNCFSLLDKGWEIKWNDATNRRYVTFIHDSGKKITLCTQK